MGCNNSSTGSQKHRLNTRYIQRQMQALGNTCTIVEVNRAFSNNAYKEETETYVNHTGVYCFVNILTEQDTSVQEGEARAGDLVFNFDYSMEPYLKQMNRIIFDGRTFQIYDVRKFDAIGNTTYLIECLTKKYSDGTAWNETFTEELDIGPIAKKLIENAQITDKMTKRITKNFTENIETSDEIIKLKI
jgi:hypothetical protein